MDDETIPIGDEPGIPGDLSGTMLGGRYKLEKRLGGGGFGVVYLARDEQLLSKLVVVKILKNPENDPWFVKKFSQEKEALARIRHHGVVEIVGDGVTADGKPFLVMQYVEGVPLRQAIRPGGIPLAQVAGIVRQIGQALSAAHQRGVCHRDLKPENIMLQSLDGEEHVVLIDFGISGIADSRFTGATTKVAGSLAYMAPEQFEGKASYASDVYALGVIAFEMLTGSVPPRGGEAKLRTLRPDLPESAGAAILKALSVETAERFASVRGFSDALCGALQPSAILTAPARPHKAPRWLLIAAGITVLLATAFYWRTRPLPPLRLTENAQQITSGARSNKFGLVTDGSRLYYAAYDFGTDVERMFQVPAKGGASISMPDGWNGKFAFDISPDRAELLLGEIGGGTVPLWSASTTGGMARRLGSLRAHDACWSPKGDEILYTTGNELHFARSDGSELRKIAALPGETSEARWSPDGQTIRFNVYAKGRVTLWEVSTNGTHLRALFPNWADHDQAEGAWTADGNYFVFSAFPPGRADTQSAIWAVSEGRGLLGRGSYEPVELTTGPMSISDPHPSPDGKRMFVIGDFGRMELVRYDPKSGHWLPYLSGESISQVDFSRGGKWMAYVGYPDGSLWRGTIDASQRIQVTAPPLRAWQPRLSPDGSQIAFIGEEEGRLANAYIVPTEGGTARELMHGNGQALSPTWSPDGMSLAVSYIPPHQPGARSLALIAVRVGHISTLAASEGLSSPNWSPDGRYIAAIGVPGWAGNSDVLLYDLNEHRQEKLATGPASCLNWSRDSQFLYFDRNSQWCRVRISDRRLDRLIDLSGSKWATAWLGLTPDGSLLSTRDTGSEEIYALELAQP